MDAIVFYLSSALLGYLMLRKFFKRAPEEEPAVELEERVVPLTVEKGTQTDELFHGPIMRVEEDSVSSDELVLEDYINGC